MRIEQLDFRRLTRQDFALLGRWLAEPHVQRWWNHDPSPAAVENDFGATVDGLDPTDLYIVSAGARPIGLIQRYRFADNPGYIAELAPLIATPGEALSMDYLIGEPDALRLGFGTAMIRTLVAKSWHDHPLAPSVIIPVNATHLASRRTLERAGFHQIAEGPLPPDNPIDPWHHVIYAVERPAGT